MASTTFLENSDSRFCNFFDIKVTSEHATSRKPVDSTKFRLRVMTMSCTIENFDLGNSKYSRVCQVNCLNLRK